MIIVVVVVVMLLILVTLAYDRWRRHKRSKQSESGGRANAVTFTSMPLAAEMPADSPAATKGDKLDSGAVNEVTRSQLETKGEQLHLEDIGDEEEESAGAARSERGVMYETNNEATLPQGAKPRSINQMASDVATRAQIAATTGDSTCAAAGMRPLLASILSGWDEQLGGAGSMESAHLSATLDGPVPVATREYPQQLPERAPPPVASVDDGQHRTCPPDGAAANQQQRPLMTAAGMLPATPPLHTKLLALLPATSPLPAVPPAVLPWSPPPAPPASSPHALLPSPQASLPSPQASLRSPQALLGAGLTSVEVAEEDGAAAKASLTPHPKRLDSRPSSVDPCGSSTRGSSSPPGSSSHGSVDLWRFGNVPQVCARPSTADPTGGSSNGSRRARATGAAVADSRPQPRLRHASLSSSVNVLTLGNPPAQPAATAFSDSPAAAVTSSALAEPLSRGRRQHTCAASLAATHADDAWTQDRTAASAECENSSLVDRRLMQMLCGAGLPTSSPASNSPLAPLTEPSASSELPSSLGGKPASSSPEEGTRWARALSSSRSRPRIEPAPQLSSQHRVQAAEARETRRRAAFAEQQHSDAEHGARLQAIEQRGKGVYAAGAITLSETASARRSELAVQSQCRREEEAATRRRENARMRRRLQEAGSRVVADRAGC